MDKNDNNEVVVNMEKGLVGVFPTLLDPARVLAAELESGEHRELPDHPGFWVSREVDLPNNSIQVHLFEENDENFVLFELKVS